MKKLLLLLPILLLLTSTVTAESSIIGDREVPISYITKDLTHYGFISYDGYGDGRNVISFYDDGAYLVNNMKSKLKYTTFGMDEENSMIYQFNATDFSTSTDIFNKAKDSNNGKNLEIGDLNGTNFFYFKRNYSSNVSDSILKYMKDRVKNPTLSEYDFRGLESQKYSVFGYNPMDAENTNIVVFQDKAAGTIKEIKDCLLEGFGLARPYMVRMINYKDDIYWTCDNQNSDSTYNKSLYKNGDLISDNVNDFQINDVTGKIGILKNNFKDLTISTIESLTAGKTVLNTEIADKYPNLNQNIRSSLDSQLENKLFSATRKLDKTTQLSRLQLISDRIDKITSSTISETKIQALQYIKDSILKEMDSLNK